VRKIQEYKDRLGSAKINESASGSALELASARAVIDEQKTKVDSLEVKIQACEKLPSNIDSAKAAVEKARMELERLKRQRDSGFESLIGNPR
jgi:hypothetical protein